jgi:hypothetical protein
MLLSMPASGLLTHDTVGSLYTLCQSFADIVLYLITTKRSLISAPAIGVPFLTASLALGTRNQFNRQLVGMLAYTSAENQAADLSQTQCYPAISNL